MDYSAFQIPKLWMDKKQSMLSLLIFLDKETLSLLAASLDPQVLLDNSNLLLNGSLLNSVVSSSKTLAHSAKCKEAWLTIPQLQYHQPQEVNRTILQKLTIPQPLTLLQKLTILILVQLLEMSITLTMIPIQLTTLHNQKTQLILKLILLKVPATLPSQFKYSPQKPTRFLLNVLSMRINQESDVMMEMETLPLFPSEK